MRFHVGEEVAENFKQVVGGPWIWKITDATEKDTGMVLQCTAQTGEFAGRWVTHWLSNSEKSAPFIKQFLLAIDYPGADGVGDLDINEADLIEGNYQFSAKSRKQRNNPDYTELYNFESIEDSETELAP